MSKFFGWFFLSLFGYIGLGYFTPRSNSWQVVSLFALLFGGFWWAAKRFDNTLRWPWLLAAAGAFRLVLLGGIPELSDDFYRFFWDGRLLATGQNPYLILPSQHPDWPLFGNLNSPGYYTVYPPLHQLLTALGPWLFPNSLFGQILTLRLLILVAEGGTVWLMLRLLGRYGLPRENVLLYALNPLVVVELTSNLHLEGVMLFLLLLAVFLLEKNRWLSAVSWGAAISVKLLPVVFLPLLVRRMGWGRCLAFGTAVAGINLLFFAPFFNGQLVENVTSSLDLYFQKFEFNASLYYLLRAVGFWWTGYNIIRLAGPALAGAALVLMALVVRWYRNQPLAGPAFFTATLLMHTAYLALATTVHPWYLTSLVGYAVCSPHRYPLVWSGVVVLSYVAYGRADFSENGWLIALEYGVVYSWLFAELLGVFRTKSPSKSTAF